MRQAAGTYFGRSVRYMLCMAAALVLSAQIGTSGNMQADTVDEPRIAVQQARNQAMRAPLMKLARKITGTSGPIKLTIPKVKSAPLGEPKAKALDAIEPAARGLNAPELTSALKPQIDLGDDRAPTFRLHLSSLMLSADADTEIARLKRLYPTTLKNTVMIAQRVTDEKTRPFTRIYAGQFSSKDNADVLCSQLKRNGQYCSVSKSAE